MKRILRQVDWPFFLAGLAFGLGTIGYYIHEADVVDWKVCAVIAGFTLGIIRGRTWFKAVVDSIKAWRNGPTR